MGDTAHTTVQHQHAHSDCYPNAGVQRHSETRETQSDIVDSFDSLWKTTTPSRNLTSNEVSQSSSVRASGRLKKLTEKGLWYQVDLHSKLLKNSISGFNRLIRGCRGMLSQDRLELHDLYDARQQLEIGLQKVSECFNKLGSYSVERCLEFQLDFDHCKTETLAMLKEITESIRTLTPDDCSSGVHTKKGARSIKSQSKVSMQSAVSHKSGRSERSAKSLVIEAAAKAAELRPN
jgi:hypothetical protein